MRRAGAAGPPDCTPSGDDRTFGTRRPLPAASPLPAARGPGSLVGGGGPVRLGGVRRLRGEFALGHRLPGADQLDAAHDLRAQVGGHVVMPAAPLDQLLHGLLQAVLLQAGGALVEVHLEFGAVPIRHLAIEKLVEMVEDLGAIRLVRLSAAHESAPFRSSDSSAAAPDAPAGTSPRPRA